MKLTITLKLQPTKEQANLLKQTLEMANKAANEASQVAWENKTFSQFKLHKIVYKQLRTTFPLSSQVVVRIIAKVADAYKLDINKQRSFHKHGSIAYDSRILTFNKTSVSIWTLNGRQTIPFVCGERDQHLLQYRQGECDLGYRKGKWFLYCTIDLAEEQLQEVKDFLGVDLGIVRLATDSTGQSFSGSHQRNLRKRHNRLRKKLQKKQSKSAKRLLKKRSLKEQRFITNSNHIISKQLVLKAKRTNSAIVLEDLRHIRRRIRANKAHRIELHGWAFAQLQSFIKYKAQLAGVEVIPVEARNSSRECHKCAHISRKNRRSQKEFQCQQCGNSCNADVNAARNLARRGAVNHPHAVGASLTASRTPLGCGR